MNKRKLLPLAVLAALVALLAAVLAVLTGLDTEETDIGIALCGLSADEVDTLNYCDASGTATAEAALTKTDGVWALADDPTLPVDQDTAETMVSTLTALTAVRELGSEADVDAMGFDEPAITLTLTAGGETWTLTVGDQNAMTGTRYVRLTGDGPVYTVETSALSGVCKTPRQLYAAQDVTELETSDVATMTVETAKGGTLTFAQTDGTWTLADDPDYSLNQNVVKKMSNTICALTTQWSVTAPQEDAAYGLDEPNAVVTLIASDGTSIRCAFGSPDPQDDTLYYLRTSGAEGVVYEVPATALDAFAYTKDSLYATPESASDESGNVMAENPVGGADDFADTATE